MYGAVQVLAGLGNPGSKYCNNRHNLGCQLLRQFAGPAHFKREKRFKAYLSREIPDLLLLIPDVWMNLSGQSVSALMKYYRLPPQTLLVVHDELDLPPGQARFKLGGGSGGHRGLDDIITLLGSKDFARLRIGTGHPGDSSQVTSWVLGNPRKDEANLYQQAFDRILQALPLALAGDWHSAMQQLHSN